MNPVLVVTYLVSRFFYRIGTFFIHWYAHTFWIVTHRTITLLERLDSFLAVKVSSRYLFQPLYKDYTAIGYAFGFIFRGLTILVGALIYFLIIVVAALIYIVWSLIPIYLIIRLF